MKMFSILSLLLITSCNRTADFKVGDCVRLDGTESWDGINILKIVEIGKSNYRLHFLFSTANITKSFPTVHELYHKVDCPKE